MLLHANNCVKIYIYIVMAAKLVTPQMTLTFSHLQSALQLRFLLIIS